MNKKIINTHDKFFKEVFSRKEEAKEFVEKNLSEKLVKNLKLDTLQLDTTEYSNKNLKTTFSDIVYNCEYKNNKTIKITLLFEHKSYSVTNPYIQLMEYILRIWKMQIKQKQKLSPIIPIIFYHGREKWIKNSMENIIEGVDDNLIKYIPKFEYELVDTNTLTDSQIKTIYDSFELKASILLFKNIFSNFENKIRDILIELNSITDPQKRDYFSETVATYIYSNINTELFQKIIEAMKNDTIQINKKFVSIADFLETRGIEKGI
ncbi:MAG: Rpn family recombination-promoting nuclease/putative transposase, partial [Bacteroidales bacterium]|nr:Rpn family recombination-promoting nuclease/putative transposase [Bacteroidales bacterium]